MKSVSAAWPGEAAATGLRQSSAPWHPGKGPPHSPKDFFRYSTDGDDMTSSQIEQKTKPYPLRMSRARPRLASGPKHDRIAMMLALGSPVCWLIMEMSMADLFNPAGHRAEPNALDDGARVVRLDED
jgi:hypothetical protein